MSTLTIRIEENLKKKAAQQAEKLGMSLTFIIKRALIDFIQSRKMVIGEPEDVIVTSNIQHKMDKIGKLI